MSFPHLNLAATANTSWLTDPLPLPGGGGVTPDFKWHGWSNGDKNWNPKKSLDQKLTPKKSHAEFPHLKNFHKRSTHKSQPKDIKNSLQQNVDEKSVQWIEALLATAQDTF